MSNRESRGWLDRVVGACLAVFLAELALFGAVQLIRAVWVWLVVGLVMLAVVAVAVFTLRRRYGGW